MSRLRFHLDEHIHPGVARALRSREIDVTTTVEAQLRTTPDTTQWEYAQREGRVIVTNDDDFLRLAKQPMTHAGVAFCAPGSRSVGQIVEMLVLFYEVYTAEEMMGRVEYL